MTGGGDCERRHPKRRLFLRTLCGTTAIGGLQATASDTVAAPAGDTKWSFETDGKIDSSPTVTDGTVFVRSDEFMLYAVDTDTGDKQCEYETESSFNSAPNVVGGIVCM